MVVLAASVGAAAVVAIATRPAEVACGAMLPRGYHGPPVTCPKPGIRWGLAVTVAIAAAATGFLMLV